MTRSTVLAARAAVMYVLGEVDPAVSSPSPLTTHETRFSRASETRRTRLLTRRQFLEEGWSLYGIGMTVLFLRFAIRLRTVGFRGFRGDDAFAFLLIVFFTLDAVTVHDVCECKIRVCPQSCKNSHQLSAQITCRPTSRARRSRRRDVCVLP